jgi:hypothetical protein
MTTDDTSLNKGHLAALAIIGTSNQTAKRILILLPEHSK